MTPSDALGDFGGRFSPTTAQLALLSLLEKALRDPHVELLEAALAYATRGWPVLPCCWPDENGTCACGRAHPEREVGKAPLLQDGVHGAATDSATIRRWWAKWPLANIGLAVEPAGLLVLDLDGPEAVEEAVSYGLSPGPVSRTGRPGGQHRFFLNPWPGLASATKRGRSKRIDIKVSGYVILPGSTHASGARYAWITSPTDAPLQPAPEWVKRYLHPAVVPEEVQLPGTLPMAPPAALHIPERIKELIPQSSPAGYHSRSEAGFAVIAAMVTGGHSDEEIAAIISLQPIGTYITERAHPDQFLKQEIGRARAKVASQPQMQAPKTFARVSEAGWEEGLPPKNVVTHCPAARGAEDVVRSGKEALRCPVAMPPSRRALYTAAELLATAMPEPRWVAEGILPEGLTLLAGKPKVGKSWLCLELALMVATGEPGLGPYTAPVGDVLYLALEDSTRRLRQRLVVLLGAKPAPETLHLATAWDRFLDGGLARMEAFLREHRGTRLIVIDTLARVRATSNGRKSAYEIDYGDLAGPQSLAAEHPGLGVLVVHHLRKNLAVDPLDLVSGTTGLTASADTVMVMSRGCGTDRFDASLFLIGRDVEERELALKRENGSPRWRVLGDAAEFAMSEQQQKIVAFLRELGEPAGPKAIADRTGVPHGSVKHLVGKLVDQGLLLRADNGTYTTNPVHRWFPDHPDHRVHLIHSDRSADGVSDGECPPFTDGVECQIEKSSRGEQGERSSDEIDSPNLGGRGAPARESSSQDEHGGEP